jgi:olefin beta-lactone synthetase
VITQRRLRAPARGWAPEIPSAAQWREWGLDPAWSRLLDVVGHDGVTRRWHVLDTGDSNQVAATEQADRNMATVVCVHGNPTWGYAWATFLRRFGHIHRVVAIDQLGMGYSERTPPRRYATRVRDLDDVIEALSFDDDRPLFVAAHDWGGAVAMGWAVDHVERIAGMILCNTGIAVPAGRAAPAVIRIAASAPMLELVCHGTPTFVEGTLRLSGKRLTAADRSAFRAPYKSATSRAAIADFVGDIPLKSGHPSERPLADVANRLGAITAPVLLAWGSRDPVFNDDFAADLEARLPRTVVHRFPNANHLVMAEADVAQVAEQFIDDVLGERIRDGRSRDGVGDAVARPDRPMPVEHLWSAIDARRHDQGVAFVDMATGDQLRFDEFADRIDAIAAELRRRGLRRGDRVAMLTPPGVDLVASVYGVWRAGGVTVVADRGLGLNGLGAAVRGARVSWVVGPRRALVAARVLRWASGAAGVDVDELVAAAPGSLPDAPSGDDVAAVLFTSGATGPAKGVVYRHRQLAAQRDALARTYGIGAADRLVAAFAPFALYGPALGITTCLPDCDVTQPGQLTADAFDAACRQVGATLAFGSPAALANVVATSTSRAGLSGLGALRIVLSAGAPVPVETLHDMAGLTPSATLHTPYGMTEALPITDIDLAGIDQAGIDQARRADASGGVCVGRPVEGADIRIVAISDGDVSLDPLATGETGEILVAAPWVSDGYLALWATQRSARPIADQRWHRSGDVGHVDINGRLWVEGRSVHLISSTAVVITPVPVERTVERGLPIKRSAAVGVGPVGRQQLVIVLEDADGAVGLVGSDVTARVRALVEHPVAAVLSLRALPVDIRHNAKIDRSAVARWADDVLAGRRARVPR